MKKLFVFLTLALVSFFITGCIDENTDPKASVENAITTINSLRHGVKPGIFTDNEDAFTNSYKIFLFVKAFTTEQLT